MQTKANGITFNTEVSGPEGAPWLIRSNSLATNLYMWDQTAKDFSGTHRVLRYDQRGHGKTEAPAARYTFDILIADIIGLMDALGIKKANWCGISMGGATAMGAVQKHPDRFDRWRSATRRASPRPPPRSSGRSASPARSRAA